METITEKQENLIAEFKSKFSGSTDFLSGVNEATYSLLQAILDNPKEWGFEIDESQRLDNKHICTCCQTSENVILKDGRQYCEKCKIFV